EAGMKQIHAVPKPLVEAVPGFTQQRLSDFVARMLAKTAAGRPCAGDVYDVLTAEFDQYSAENPTAEGRFVLDSKGRTSSPSLHGLPQTEPALSPASPGEAAHL